MEERITDAINQAIDSYLSDNSLSPTYLASKLGITTASLHNKQTGRTDWKWSEILKLCNLLETTPDKLAGLAMA